MARKYLAAPPTSEPRDETVLEDLPMFVKYGMTNLVKEAVPYAAALPMEVLAAHRRKNSPHMSGNHAWYSSVYEAKANRANNETHTPVAVYHYTSDRACYCGEIVLNRCAKCTVSLCDKCKPEKCLKFHHCQMYGRRMAPCLCGYDFDEQFLIM
uniref:Uncharacterized protein n=1 Tax=Romanomermis culicivorax TaxID=13658 RepID=A0A915L358_ROMCU